MSPSHEDPQIITPAQRGQRRPDLISGLASLNTIRLIHSSWKNTGSLSGKRLAFQPRFSVAQAFSFAALCCINLLDSYMRLSGLHQAVPSKQTWTETEEDVKKSETGHKAKDCILFTSSQVLHESCWQERGKQPPKNYSVCVAEKTWSQKTYVLFVCKMHCI